MIDNTSNAAQVAAAINNTGRDLRVMSYNVGHWAMGASPTPTYSDLLQDGYPTTVDRNYDRQLLRWKSLVKAVDADIIGMPEFSENFGTKNDSLVAVSDTGIFNGYNLSVGKTAGGGYWINTIASKFALSSVGDENLDSTVSNIAYYHHGLITLNGKSVMVVATHLNWNQSPIESYYASRQAEIRSLIRKLQPYPYVIICGDFNTEGPGAGWDATKFLQGASEYEPFTCGFEDGGFSYGGDYQLANCGAHGTTKTVMASYSRPDKNDGSRPMVPYGYYDNIIVKGFDITAVRVIDDGRLTDHCGIVADLTMKE